MMMVVVNIINQKEDWDISEKQKRQPKKFKLPFLFVYLSNVTSPLSCIIFPPPHSAMML